MEGGRTQQSAIGGVSSASSSISVRSFGRSCTQTLSSLSTARPVTPPIFHLFGRGLGQSGSNLNLGTAGSGAPNSGTLTANAPSTASTANTPASTLRLLVIDASSVPKIICYRPRHRLEWTTSEVQAMRLTGLYIAALFGGMAAAQVPLDQEPRHH